MQMASSSGADYLAREYQREVTRAFGRLSERASDAGLHTVRSIVAESWQRSLGALPPTGREAASLGIDPDDLARLRSEGPLADALPIVRRLLIEPARDTGLVVAIGDAQGRLLWVEGDHSALRRSESMGFAVGTDWSETGMGTSAPGIVVATGSAASVVGEEHFSPSVREWSCTAVPLMDPHTRALLGVLDITGGSEAVSPLSLPLLTAAAAAIEAELAAQPPLSSPGSTDAEAESREALVVTGTSRAGEAGGLGAVVTGSPAPPAADASLPGPVVRVTGPGAPVLLTSGREQQIGLRHAEILALLDWHDEGLTGPQLGEMVYTEVPEAATVRVEMHRLRRVLAEASAGSVELASRPYRLVSADGGERAPLTDARAARDALADGDADRAVLLCRGEVLPSSFAPGAERIRSVLAAELREAVMQFADHDLLWTYLRRRDAQDDREAWMLALQLLPADDIRRAAAVARLDAIEAELGAG